MTPLLHIGIVGCGKMGMDLFHYFCAFNLKITLICHTDEQANLAGDAFVRKQDRALKYGLIKTGEFDLNKQHKKVSVDLEALGSCDVVIESISENLEMKQRLFKQLHSVLAKHCIICTNTSSLPVAALLPPAPDGRQIAGLHFFYPVAHTQWVEINLLDNCESHTGSTLLQLAELINKRPLILQENHHFLMNKLFLPLQAACCRLHMMEGLPIDLIDAWVKKNIFPPGIFEFFDSVGIDVMLPSVQAYTKNLPGKSYYTSFIELLSQLSNEGRLGVKTGVGFYRYVKGKKVGIPETEVDRFPPEFTSMLYDCYLNPLFEVVSKGIVDRKTLVDMVADYSRSDQQPFELAEQLGFSYNQMNDMF